MNVMQMYSMFQQNPMALLRQRYNIPQNISNPNDIIQYLLNTGQITQAQVNYAMQMRNNPMFRR